MLPYERVKEGAVRFYRRIGNHGLEIDRFIIIGGAALTLQLYLNETKDIDITTRRRDLDQLKLSISPIEATSMMAKYRFDGIDYQVGTPRAIGLVKPFYQSEPLTLDGTTIYLRPVDLVKKDYQSVIERTRNIAIGVKEDPSVFLKFDPCPKIITRLEKLEIALQQR